MFSGNREGPVTNHLQRGMILVPEISKRVTAVRIEQHVGFDIAAAFYHQRHRNTKRHLRAGCESKTRVIPAIQAGQRPAPSSRPDSDI